VANKYGISREEQDQFGYRSHMRAIAAQDAGKFKDEIAPLDIEQVVGFRRQGGLCNGRRPECGCNYVIRDNTSSHPWGHHGVLERRW
jgi:hypothetical protein